MVRALLALLHEAVKCQCLVRLAEVQTGGESCEDCPQSGSEATSPYVTMTTTHSSHSYSYNTNDILKTCISQIFTTQFSQQNFYTLVSFFHTILMCFFYKTQYYKCGYDSYFEQTKNKRK